MPQQFNEVLIDVYPNTPGGLTLATARQNSLIASGYRVMQSQINRVAVWANRMPGGAIDTAAAPSLMLMSVKP